MSTAELYHQVRIHLEIELKTALHIGSGMVDSIGDRASTQNKDEEGINPDYDRVCLDTNNNPYLPGSSLRGQLRSLATTIANNGAEQGINDDWINHFFENPNLDNSLGDLRVHDAFWLSSPAATEFSNSRKSTSEHSLPTRITHGIAIDPIRQVVDAHKLFNYEMIPEATRFDWVIEIDRMNHSTLESLCSLLNVWQQKAMSLGRNSQKGDGQASCKITSIEVATTETLHKWLQSEKNEGVSSYFKAIEISDVTTPVLQESWTIHYQLMCKGVMLVNDPDRVQVKDEKHDDAKPQQVYARLENGTAYLPGKSIKGLFRAHSRKILMTLLMDEGCSSLDSMKKADDLLIQLFGSTKKAACLSVAHALDCSDSSHAFTQAFIAVDRFTGGVKDGALFMAKGLMDGLFEGEITMLPHLLPDTRRYPEDAKDWWKGLLLLVTKDMMEGDGALGWGKSKGYGHFRLTSLQAEENKVSQWGDFQTQNAIPSEQLVQWVEALNACIKISASSVQATDKGALYDKVL